MSNGAEDPVAVVAEQRESQEVKPQTPQEEQSLPANEHVDNQPVVLDAKNKEENVPKAELEQSMHEKENPEEPVLEKKEEDESKEASVSGALHDPPAYG